MTRPSPRARHRARRAAVQALYQWQITAQPAGEIIVQFHDSPALVDADLEYFRRLVNGVPEHVEALDAAIVPALTRPLAQVDPVERAVLRLGAFELIHCPEVPFRVVIDEAIELAKTFGAEQGHRFVNGVLDRLAPQLRPQETGTSPPPARDRR